MVEMQDVIRQRFSRPVREKPAAVAPDGIRQPAAGGLQVTLKTHLELTFAAKPGRIEDRITARLFGVRATGSVATLAIDALGNFAVQDQLALGALLGIGVGLMAKKTLAVYPPAEVHMIGTVVSGIHGPEATPLRVP